LRKSFNLISWDPRGVGQSDPVSCLTTAQQTRSFLAVNPDPSTKKEINQEIQSIKGFVADCVKHTSKALLENISTSNDVRDLNLLRMDFRQAKLNYLGFSYGTYLGELYAQMFPHTIRAMTLDGVFDPDLSTLQLDAAQAAGFESELNGFFKYCDKNSTCSQGLPGGAASQFRQIMKQFKNGSTVVGQLLSKYGGNVTVNYAIALLGTIAALYSPKTWPLLGVGLGDIISNGNGQVLAGLAYSYAGLQLNGNFSNQYSANIAINCADRPSFGSLSQLEKSVQKLGSKYQDFGASVVWGNLECLYWPVKHQGSPGVIHAPGTPTILLVGSTGDPATPYQWAKSVANQLDNAVLLTRVGNGHLGYFVSTCVQGYVDNYFANLQLPKKNTTCH
jgi:pimeloyl-ACP methyl ester carboxylesterase